MPNIKKKVINNIVYSMPSAVFNHIEDLEQKNIRLRNRIKELQKDCNSCNFHKYKQALEEIRNYCTTKNEMEFIWENNFYRVRAKDIIKIIDEVLNGWKG